MDKEKLQSEQQRMKHACSETSGLDSVDADHHLINTPMDSGFQFERVEGEEVVEILGSLDLSKATGLEALVVGYL